MNVLTRTLAILLFVCLLGTASASAQASSQATTPGDCYDCAMSGGGFRCVWDFGGFGNCTANWDGCLASGRCTTVFGIIGADGSVIPPERQGTEGDVVTFELAAMREVSPGAWYRTNCSGIVLERRFSKHAIAILRAESRVLAL